MRCTNPPLLYPDIELNRNLLSKVQLQLTASRRGAAEETAGEWRPLAVVS